MNPLLAELRKVDPSPVTHLPQLRCPACGQDAHAEPEKSLQGKGSWTQCEYCYYKLVCQDGIWNALPPARQAYYARFIREYEEVRSREGRGSSDPAYYLALPSRDLTGRNTRQWQIRARTCEYLERSILPALRRELGRPLDILDLGAGVGWLSYRLSLLGDRPVAVDLIPNSFDGLGAARNYHHHLRNPFPCFRAELDCLPFAGNQFDCAIFNASFHYSENYESTLREALRCLRSNGRIIIADTAWYQKRESGEQMLAERRRAFLQSYGFPSDALKSEEFLTDERLHRLAVSLGIRWEMHQPWYGIRWAMRPWVARWKKRREPSRFRIYIGQARA